MEKGQKHLSGEVTLDLEHVESSSGEGGHVSRPRGEWVCSVRGAVRRAGGLEHRRRGLEGRKVGLEGGRDNLQGLGFIPRSVRNHWRRLSREVM